MEPPPPPRKILEPVPAIPFLEKVLHEVREILTIFFSDINPKQACLPLSRVNEDIAREVAEHREILRAAVHYSIARIRMAQICKAIPNGIIKEVFSLPLFRSNIARSAGWHHSFEKGQPNEGFAERFEALQQRRAHISEHDFITKVIQRPKV